MTGFRMPSAAELYAFEKLARRERAQAQARLICAAAEWLKRGVVSLFTKPYGIPRGKVAQHA